MERFLSPQHGYPFVPRGIPGAARQRPTRGLQRSKTLTRPERGVAPPPLIQPTTAPRASDAIPLPRGRGSLFVPNSTPIFTGDRKSWWKTSSSILTFWAPSFFLTHLGRMHTPMKRQAWREKMLVVMAALVLGCVTAFFTVGVNRVMCPNGRDGGPEMTLLGRTASKKPTTSFTRV
jgi:chitin synthase